ncbi:hypothetical protein HGO23_12820 [Xenorhabdus budapestensis]|uniref:DNA polymerase III subunit beta n=1 Tax=Xenorhabdus budapestensis TaxID=290110 RepID=A0ABX7VFQ1_XENBU|nr:hypothetical protein [Xenorhabdus budapestensis]QTL38761.1 hypothetical protein HGO23_12820 [Xenorhabdus budapestensis]
MELKINRGTLLAVLECRSSIKNPRPYLCGICFRQNGRIVATDGHILAYARHENEIDRDLILSVGKLPTRNFEYAEFDTGQGIVRLFDKQNNLIGATHCSEIDGTYPNIDRVIQEAESAENNGVFEIAFATRYLLKLERMTKYINPTNPVIKIKTTTATSAALCNISNSTGESVSVMIMPVRI